MVFGAFVRANVARFKARPNTNVGGFGVVESSVGADPSSAQRPEQKQQAADRPLDEPGSDQAEAINKKTQAAESAMSRDPDDRSGEPMKMHDPSQQERQGSIGQQGGGEHGKEKGTGEKWEKSTGLASEGGDFDATRPGAGKEANREPAPFAQDPALSLGLWPGVR